MADLLAFPPLPSPAPAETASPRRPSAADAPPDLEARVRALDIEASWIVEAPAGSGKTGLLMQRLLKLLAFGRVAQPEEVLAITFTRKATAELRERLLAQLHAASRQEPLAPKADSFQRQTRALAESVLRRDAELGWGLLDRPARLSIRTIDAVCGEIARTLPLLSGSGGSREPVEDPGDLHRTAAARTLDGLGGEDLVLDRALRLLLLHRDGSLSDCIALIAGMLQTREQWGRLVPFAPGELSDDVLDRDVRPRLERALEEVVCSGLSRALRLFPAQTLQELMVLAADFAHLPGYKGAASPLLLFAGRDHPPQAVAADLDLWLALVKLLITGGSKWRTRLSANDLGVELGKEGSARLEQIIADCSGQPGLAEALCAIRKLPSAHYPDEQWQMTRALFHILRHALVELKLLFAERGQCDFTELSMAAREVLSTNEGAADLAEASGLRLRHLLVDEMQDTSTSQYDLLELMIRHWGGEGETLFLVGDPKQSVYLFRQARVERFLRTFREERLGHFPLRPLRLTANFRTQARLVSGFNRTFEAVFPARVSADQPADVPFVTADAIRPPSARAELRWHARLLRADDDPGTLNEERHRHQQREARAIRRIVEDWQARPHPGREPWRLAILGRTREHLAPVIAEFNRKREGRPAVPFRAVDVDLLRTRPEVLDLLALTRALLHPGDRVAWLAVLHAPWCGLDRADLLALTGEGTGSEPDATMLRLVPMRAEHISAEGRVLLSRAWPVLVAAVQSLGRTPLSLHVERTWRSLGGDAPLEPDARTNVLQFFKALRGVEQEDGGRVELPRLKARLDHLYAEPRAAVGAVELLTIHKSKGLEWDVVLVPELERRAPHPRSELLNWVELDSNSDEAAHVVLAPIFGKGEESDQLNTWLRSVRVHREASEAKRLLYVASTRAREELHLFGACALKKGEFIVEPPANSILRAGWSAAQPHFERRVQWMHEEADSAETSQPVLLPFPVAESTAGGPSDDGLALAASAEAEVSTAETSVRAAPLIHRLPLAFHPLDRFRRSPEQRLSAGMAVSARQTAPFERPEGSFAARAFGNVVHRFLAQVAVQLGAGDTPDRLLTDLPAWEPRLRASLRAEGLAPALTMQEAARVVHALTNALTDEHGRWILSPRELAADECALTPADGSLGGLRVDRTFLAGVAPLLPGSDTVWIVDYKTAEPGGRELSSFLLGERQKYQAQLEAYAQVRRSLSGSAAAIRLALYYPLIPALVQWESGVAPQLS